MKSNAEMVSDSWEAAVQRLRGAMQSPFDLTMRPPGPPPTPEEHAAREAEWAAWSAEQAAKQAVKDERFKG